MDFHVTSGRRRSTRLVAAFVRAVRLTAAFVTVCLLVALAMGCEPDEPTTSVVFGVTSDYRAGSDLERLDVVMTVDGEVVLEGSLPLGASAGNTDFPEEFTFADVAIGARLSLRLRGYKDDQLVVERLAESEATHPEKRLLRIHLEILCSRVPPIGSPKEPVEACALASDTCISSKCQPAFVSPADQEIYADDWAKSFNDVCKPVGGGAPEVIVGEGSSDYLAMSDYDEAIIEAGPQGGHHIWVAARVRNLNQSGSLTTVGGEVPSLGLSITPLQVIFTMDVAEGGACKLYGLRFQIDIDGNDVMDLLGVPMRVFVSVKDLSGDIGTGERWVTLSNIIE